MILTLKEIEPFNIPPVDNNQAGMFMRHLTGNEEFEYESDKKPLSMLLYEINYKHPALSTARAYLLGIDIDTFEDICNSDQYETMDPILKKYVIGIIRIEIGGDLSSPRVYGKEFDLENDKVLQ